MTMERSLDNAGCSATEMEMSFAPHGWAGLAMLPYFNKHSITEKKSTISRTYVRMTALQCGLLTSRGYSCALDTKQHWLWKVLWRKCHLLGCRDKPKPLHQWSKEMEQGTLSSPSPIILASSLTVPCLASLVNRACWLQTSGTCCLKVIWQILAPRELFCHFQFRGITISPK